MADVIAQIDGIGELHFPEGTDPNVIHQTVQKLVMQHNAPAPLSGPIGAKVPEPDMAPTVGQNAAYEALEGGKGVLKGAVGTSQGLSDLMSPKGSFFDTGHVMNTDATNPDQLVGKGLESAAEMALPMLKGAEAIPSASRAGATLGRVADAAKDVRVPLTNSIAPLQRVTELGERGGTLPTSANALLKRSQMLGDMTFPEARDYYSNISGLSADEANKLNPIMKKAVGGLKAGFHGDLTAAANQVGLGDEYANAIKEYRNAMRLKDLGQTALTKVLPAGGVLGAIGYGINKLRGQ